METLNEVLASVVDSGGLPGVAATVGDRDGVIFRGAAGVDNIDTGRAMTPDTVVWIASCTKALTTTGVMQLVEQGRLDLDAPAAEVLPELGDVAVLTGFGNDGQPTYRPPKGYITLRHLLTHTSGYGYEIWAPELLEYNKVTGTPAVTTCENAALTTPLLFDPGTQWMYGIGIDWAGKMLEAVTGNNLGSYLAESVFGPLGMTDTAFRISDDMRSRLASVHTRDAAGGFSPIPLEIPQDPEFEMGGGGLYSTVGDYLRFLRALLRGGELDGERILAPATVEEMGRNNVGDIEVITLRTAVPPASHDADFFPDQTERWGLSFLINTEETAQGRSPGSLAWAGLANTYYWLDRQRGTCGVWTTQLMPFVDPVAVANFFALEAAVNGR